MTPKHIDFDRRTAPPGANALPDQDGPPAVHELTARIGHHRSLRCSGLCEFAAGSLTGAQTEVFAANVVAHAAVNETLLTRVLDRTTDLTAKRLLVDRISEELGRDAVPRPSQLERLFRQLEPAGARRGWELGPDSGRVLPATRQFDHAAVALVEADEPKACGALLARELHESQVVSKLETGFARSLDRTGSGELESLRLYFRELPSSEGALLAAARSARDPEDLEQVRTGFYEMLGLIDRFWGALSAAVSPFADTGFRAPGGRR